MLQLMAILVIIDILVKLPDYKLVRELRKRGWKGGLKEFYEWKRR